MAFDLSIEIFAYDIFSKMYVQFDIIKPSVFEIYGDECYKMSNYVEACDNMFHDAVLSRVMFFKSIYLKDLTTRKIRSLKSLTDCCNFVTRICDRNDFFGHLTVFERMFATLAFVLHFSFRIYYDNPCSIDICNYSHLFWAMYFDKLTEKFYKEGGWNELKRVAISYFELNWFIYIFIFDSDDDDENDLNAMKEMFDNYQQFKSVTNFCKYRHPSKQWAKFHTKNFENYIIVPFNYQFSIDAYEAELLFEVFKRLCGSHLENCIPMFKRRMPFDSFEEVNASDNDSLPITHFVSEQQSNCRELLKKSTMCEELPSSECSFENSKEVSFKFIGNTTNLKSDEKSFIEKDLRKSNSVSLAAHVQNNRIPNKIINEQFGLVSENMNFHLDRSSENILLDIKNELCPTKDFSSKSLNDISSDVVLSKSSENSPNIPPLAYFISKNEYKNGNNEGICTETDGIDITANTSSVDETALCNRSENRQPEQVYSLQCFKPVNKWENTADEKAKTIEVTADLKYQNVDCVVSDLLRMILVLGDRQGIEYVLSTVNNSKGIHQNLQENLIQRKKRHKKEKKNSRI